MIYITCGTCGTSQGYKTQADGALTLPAAEEKRLVARGVAEYVTKPIIGTAGGVATPGEGGDGGNQGDTPPEHAPGSTGLENGGDDDTADLQEGETDAPDSLDIVDGYFTIESLMELSRADMEKLAADMGVDVKKCRNKGDIAKLLAAVEVSGDADGEAPPELGAEAPVV